VANFTLKKNFTGVDVTSTYGATADEKDAKRRRTDITVGSSLADGRGNVVMHVGTTRTSPLQLAQRDIDSSRPNDGGWGDGGGWGGGIDVDIVEETGGCNSFNSAKTSGSSSVGDCG
jgi:hypothetical protein